MFNNQKINRSIFVFLFLGLISFPLAGKLSRVGTTSLDNFKKTEKRLPHKNPKLPTSISEFKKFPSDFESAFNDHLPFRKLLIRFYGELSVRLLKVSTHKQLLIGKNGHCFLASHGDGDNDLIFNTLEIDSPRIEQKTADLKKNESFLRDLKVPVLVIAIPTSPLFEFSNLPRFLQKEIDVAFLETPPAQQLLNNMPRMFAEKYFLFPYQRALDANKDYPLFPEKNFHWQTSRYTKLMANCIVERFGIAPYEKPGFDEFVKRRTVSDLSSFAGTKLFNRNDLIYKSDIWKTLSIRDEEAAVVYENYPVFPWCRYTINPSQKGKLLVVGDSFTPALRFDLARHFSEVLSVNFNLARNNPNIQEWFQCVFEDIRPDYIVFSSHNEFNIYEEFVSGFNLVQNQIKKHHL